MNVSDSFDTMMGSILAHTMMQFTDEKKVIKNMEIKHSLQHIGSQVRGRILQKVASMLWFSLLMVMQST